MRQLSDAATRLIDAGGRASYRGSTTRTCTLVRSRPAPTWKDAPVVEQDPSLDEILQRVKSVLTLVGGTVVHERK